MHKSAGFIFKRNLAFLFLLLFLASSNANAEGKGEDSYIALEPFTVNLVGLHQVLQIAITLKPAKPDMAEKIKAYVPTIRNEIILLLSEKTPEEIQSAEGKKKLIVETRKAANKALGLTAKDGISEALFVSIIVQ